MAPGLGETKAWTLYFGEHFPRGAEHAELLWIRWRIALVKDEYPGPGIAISHGQPHAHWKTVDPGGLLFIDLESMWNDFEQSVDSFIELLRRDEARREAALDWWASRQYSVQMVAFTPPAPSAGVLSTASVTATDIVKPN